MKKATEKELRTMEGGKVLTGCDALNAEKSYGLYGYKYYAYCTKCRITMGFNNYGQYIAFQAFHKVV